MFSDENWAISESWHDAIPVHVIEEVAEISGDPRDSRTISFTRSPRDARVMPCLPSRVSRPIGHDTLLTGPRLKQATNSLLMSNNPL